MAEAIHFLLLGFGSLVCLALLQKESDDHHYSSSDKRIRQIVFDFFNHLAADPKARGNDRDPHPDAN